MQWPRASAVQKLERRGIAAHPTTEAVAVSGELHDALPDGLVLSS